MRILFVIPPYRTTDALVAQLYPMPLGVVSMATVLAQAGHTVEIKDFLVPAQKSKAQAPAVFKGLGAPPYRHYGLPLPECLAWLDANLDRFDVVGLAMGQCNLHETSTILGRYITGGGKPLVIGGPFVSTATEEALAFTGATVAVVGEGELVVEEAFLAATRGPAIIQGQPAVLADLPVPDWSLAPPKNYPMYQGKVRGVLAVSRGCPHACRFCSVHTIAGRKHRRQSRERITREILGLAAHGVRYFCFLDDNLFISEQAVDEVMGAIDDAIQEVSALAKAKFYVEEGLEIRMAAKPGIVERIAAYRFENIALGLETMSGLQRDAQAKPYDEADLAQAVANCQAAGIVAKAFYVVGFPGDTVGSVCEDLVAFGRLGLAVRPNNLKLYPGTETTAQFLDEGWIDAGYDWRMSSWYTPRSGALGFADIKRLKTVLGAIGKAAELGIALFSDTMGVIADKLAARNYTLEVGEDGSVTIHGKMFRVTPFRHMAGLLALREGAQGVDLQTGDNLVRAVPLASPKDAIQAGIVQALRPEASPRVGTLSAWRDPSWIVGDSRNLTDLAPGSYDFIFGCPPYYDLEVYSDDPRDVSKAATYEEFLAVYRAVIAQAVGLLKENRFACFVVGDVRGGPHGFYRGFVEDTVRAFEDAGAHKYNEAILVTAVGSLPVWAGRQFSIGRKLGKTHQNILVFCKGDPRLATEAVGPVSVVDFQDEADA